MNKVACVGAASNSPGPLLVGGALLAAGRWPMMWQAGRVDDDVVPPTSLNEGRGKVFLVLAPEVPGCGGGTGRTASG